MEAIQALQLQTDAKHRRITNQVIHSIKHTLPGTKYSFLVSEPWVDVFLYCSSLLALCPVECSFSS